MRLEGSSEFKYPVTLGTETTTFRLVAQCLNEVRYHEKLKKLGEF
jgi:hypothetical protein